MKKSDLVILFFVVLIILAAAALLTPLLAEQSRLQDEVARLIHEQQQVKRELSILQKEIDALGRGEAKAVMRVTHEKFNYCREGEEIYQLEYVSPEE